MKVNYFLDLFRHYRPANEVCEGYVFTGVCLSTEGVPGQVPPGRYTPTLGQVHPPTLGQVYPNHRAGTPPGHSACWDTVNKRVARILLECILVIIFSDIFK